MATPEVYARRIHAGSKMTSGLPFDDFRSLLATLNQLDAIAAETASAEFRQAGGDRNSPATVEGVAAWLAGSRGRAMPAVGRPVLAILAHDIDRDMVAPRHPAVEK